MARNKKDTDKPEEATEVDRTELEAAEPPAETDADAEVTAEDADQPEAMEEPVETAEEADVSEEQTDEESQSDEGSAADQLDTEADPLADQFEAEVEGLPEELHFDEHHDDDHHDLEEHGIFPTWVKVVIILLFGAGIALWGGPRLAPLLPSGLAPVADFLTPGSVKQAEEFEARIVALESRRAPEPVAVPEVDVTDQIDAAVAEYDAAIRAQLAELGDAVAAIENGDIEARLAAVETSLAGLDAQMTSLTEQMTSAIAEGMDQQSALGAEQAAAYQAMIDRLEAEVAQMAARQGAIDQKINEVAAASTRIAQEAEEKVAQAEEESRARVDVSLAAKAVTDIAVALETGASFRASLDRLQAAVGETDLPALGAVADSGTVSLDELKTAFPSLAYAALRASMQADTDGYVSSALSFVKSQVATRSLTPQEGTSTNAVLSRIEAALNDADLAACLTEAEGLDAAARAEMEGWLGSVDTLAQAMAELETASAAVSSLSN